MHKKMKRTSLLFALAVTVAMVATACAPNTGATPAAGDEPGTSDGQPAALEKLVLAVPNATFFTSGLAYHVAHDKGIYEKHGLDVEMTATSGGSGSIQAVVSGSADMSVDSGAPGVIAAYGDGGPVRVVGATTTGLDLLWFSDAKQSIKKLEDLSGKKIGFSSNGSSSQLGTFAINEALKDMGLEPAEPVAIGGVSDQYTAVMTGQIAAGFTEPPSLMSNVKAGELTIVADITKLPNASDWSNVAVRLTTANAKFIQENPETVKKFIAAQTEAWDWIFANKKEAVDLWKKDADLKESTEVLMTVFDYFKRENMRLEPLDGIDKILQVSQTTGFLKKPLTDDQVNELFGFAKDQAK